MIEFFTDLLYSLPKLTGINQLEPNNKPRMSKEDIIELRDILVSTCKRFGKITDDKKRLIITNGVLNDPKFYGLNANKIQHYLSTWWERQTQVRQLQLSREHTHLSKEEKEQQEAYKLMYQEELRKNPKHSPAQQFYEMEKKILENSYEGLVESKNEIRGKISLKESFINLVTAQIEAGEIKEDKINSFQERIKEAQQVINNLYTRLEEIESEYEGRHAKRFKSVLPGYNEKKI